MSRIFFTIPATPATTSMSTLTSCGVIRDMVRTQSVNLARFDALEAGVVIVVIIRRAGEGGPNGAMLQRKAQLGSGSTERPES